MIMIVHSELYKGFNFDRLVHKARLNHLLKKLKNFNFAFSGRWADFGCSDGFILEIIQTKLPLSDWTFFGFDKSDGLLSKARNRNIPNSTFLNFDLNKLNDGFSDNFDVVSCFETLEHTGNYKNAYQNIYVCEGRWINCCFSTE